MNSYPIERHLRVRTIKSPQFGPDSESLYFRCNLTGNNEVWRIDSPGEWPTQVTFTGRDVTFAAWSPTGDEMAFGTSRASERAQFYAHDAETEAVTRLTDDPDVVHRWGGWNRDGTRFAYAANRRRPDTFDVYTQGRSEATDEARLVYEQDRRSPVFPIGWGPGSDRLLVLEMHSNYNADLHVADLDDGTTERLTDGPSSKARFRSVRWDPDQRALYLITDDGHDWLYLGRLDLDTGEIEPVVRTDANVESFVLHNGRNRIAYRETEGGSGDIVTGRLTNPTDVDPFPAPDLPRGDGKSLTMSADGERLAMVYVTPKTSPEIYSVEVETGRSTRWTAMSQPVSSENFVAPASVSYESFDGLEIPSLYAVPEENGDEPLPAVISLHSGPRQNNSLAFDPLRQYYLEQGFVGLEPDYRGSSGYGKAYMQLDDRDDRPDAIRDVKAAADWLAEREVVDADRIVLQGWSYGGFLVLAALTRWPDRFAAGAAISPIANFETFLENIPDRRQQNREAEYGSLEDDRELLRELSPIHDVDRVRTPLLVAHGENDRKVPVEEARQIAEAARDHDVSVETLFVDAGHGFDARENEIELFERVTDFFATHV